jgi:hypothetical protein
MLVAAGTAKAQGSAENAAAAETLFQEGKKLMAEGKYREACPKLMNSQQLDPAVGTLLNLADCYERKGQIASAWATFKDAATGAKANGQTEREETARRRAVALEPRLPRLVIEVPSSASPAVTEIKRDGAVVPRGVWGVQLPVDPGDHVVEVQGPGRKPWSQRVTVVEGKTVTLTVPASGSEAATTGPLGEPAPRAPAEAEPQTAGGGTSVVPTVGWVAVGVGAAAAVAGGALALTAKSSYADAIQHCGSNVGAPSDTLCDPGYTDQRNSAVSRASAATWLVVGGAAMAATGLVLVIAAPRGKAEAPRAALNIAPGGLSFRGAF